MSDHEIPKGPGEVDEAFLLLPKVGLVGPNRAGKGVASELLTAQKGFLSVTLSQAIRDYAKEQDIPLVRSQDYWNTRLQMEKEMGEDVLLQKSITNVKERLKSTSPPSGVVFDGVRTRPVAESFKKLPHAVLLAIEASPETRYARRRPERPEDHISFSEFVEYDQIEQLAIQELDGYIDEIIYNEGSITAYQNEVIIFLRNHFSL